MLAGTRTIFLIALIVTAFFSCSKSKTDSPKTDPCDRIVELFDWHPYETPQYQLALIFTYDAQGRVTLAKGPGMKKAEYTYYKDKIVVNATDNWGVNTSRTYFLDNMGRIKGTDFFDHQYTYDSEGYLISVRQYYEYNGQVLGFHPYFLKWENGNLAELYTTDQIAAHKKVTFQYYDSPNQNMAGFNEPFYIGQILYDINSLFLLQSGFFGKQSKNLLKDAIINDVDFPGMTTYKYDAKGRIIQVSQNYKYNYQCP